jgi:hypothetical protein
MSLGAKPTEDIVSVTLPTGTSILNDPSAEDTTALAVPLSEMVTPAKPTLSREETTFPEMVRFCAVNTNEISIEAMQNRTLALNIRSVLEVTE